MTPDDLLRLKKWFQDYSESFLTPNEEDRRNILLKIRHTENVCNIIRHIAENQTSDLNIRLLAETAALFHDVGRFPQYAEFRTFRDAISVNHGKLGAGVLGENNVLGFLSQKERENVTDAVRYHNAFALPAVVDADTILILKMVRDADKLDIWCIFLGFYENGQNDIASQSGLGLPDRPEFSEKVLSSLLSGKSASMSDLRTLNDFILMQLSWVYDLNFRKSFAVLAEKDYVRRLIDILPKDKRMSQLSEILSNHIQRRLETPVNA